MYCSLYTKIAVLLSERIALLPSPPDPEDIAWVRDGVPHAGEGRAEHKAMLCTAMHNLTRTLVFLQVID